MRAVVSLLHPFTFQSEHNIVKSSLYQVSLPFFSALFSSSLLVVFFLLALTPYNSTTKNPGLEVGIIYCALCRLCHFPYSANEEILTILNEICQSHIFYFRAFPYNKVYKTVFNTERYIFIIFC